MMWTLWGGSQAAPSPSDGPVWRDLNSHCSLSICWCLCCHHGCPFSSCKGFTAGMDGISLQKRMFPGRQRELLKSTAYSYLPNATLGSLSPFLTGILTQTDEKLTSVNAKGQTPDAHKQKYAARGEQESPAPNCTLLAKNSWHLDGQYSSLLNPSFSSWRSLVISSLVSGGGVGALGTFGCVPWGTCSLHTSHFTSAGAGE